MSKPGRPARFALNTGLEAAMADRRPNDLPDALQARQARPRRTAFVPRPSGLKDGRRGAFGRRPEGSVVP
jgi:hypothetical protein